jgi:hypothetical protein
MEMRHSASVEVELNLRVEVRENRNLGFDGVEELRKMMEKEIVSYLNKRLTEGRSVKPEGFTVKSVYFHTSGPVRR